MVYTGNGTTTSFNVPFKYLDRSHVVVKIDGVVQTSEYYWSSTNTIEFTTAPDNGKPVVIGRNTPRDTQLVEFRAGAALKASELNTTAQQLLHIMQEDLDENINSFQYDLIKDCIDAQGRRIANLGLPAEDHDALSKYHYETTLLPEIQRYIDDLYAYLAGIGGSSSHFFPKGGIVMWSGKIEDIPLGWALCDGTKGTPDLLDRFILGVPDKATNPGVKGGAHTVKLTTANMPEHTHAHSLQAHRHSYEHTHTIPEHSTNVSAAGAHKHALDGHVPRSSKAFRWDVTQPTGGKYNNVPYGDGGIVGQPRADA